jgi:hypothetical protein
MDDKKIIALREEIGRRAPHLRIVQAGALFTSGLDAIVEDRKGQYLWSVYARELDPQPPAAAAEPLPGQRNLF